MSVEDFVIDDGVLVEYRGFGGRMVIPEGAESIGEDAFSGCASLASIKLAGGKIPAGLAVDSSVALVT